MMEQQLERDNDRLRMVIETMQRDGRPERDVEKAVRQAARGLHRDAGCRPSRRLVRFSLRRRAPEKVDAPRW